MPLRFLVLSLLFFLFSSLLGLNVPFVRTLRTVMSSFRDYLSHIWDTLSRRAFIASARCLARYSALRCASLFLLFWLPNFVQTSFPCAGVTVSVRTSAASPGVTTSAGSLSSSDKTKSGSSPDRTGHRGVYSSQQVKRYRPPCHQCAARFPCLGNELDPSGVFPVHLDLCQDFGCKALRFLGEPFLFPVVPNGFLSARLAVSHGVRVVGSDVLLSGSLFSGHSLRYRVFVRPARQTVRDRGPWVVPAAPMNKATCLLAGHL